LLNSRLQDKKKERENFWFYVKEKRQCNNNEIKNK